MLDRLVKKQSGRSSAVEHFVANEDVVSSILIARSNQSPWGSSPGALLFGAYDAWDLKGPLWISVPADKQSSEVSNPV